jgi:hypothetical protein
MTDLIFGVGLRPEKLLMSFSSMRVIASTTITITKHIINRHHHQCNDVLHQRPTIYPLSHEIPRIPREHSPSHHSPCPPTTTQTNPTRHRSIHEKKTRRLRHLSQSQKIQDCKWRILACAVWSRQTNCDMSSM